MKTRITRAPLLAKLRELGVRSDQVPEGFKPAKQWAAEWDLALAHTTKLLQRGIEAGLMKRKVFRIRVSPGRSYPVAHFIEVRGTS